MSRAVSPVSGRRFGLAAVCRAWRLARSTVHRHRAPAAGAAADASAASPQIRSC